MSFFKMTIIVTITVIIVGIGGTLYIYYNQDKFDLPFVSSINFKKEYEELNNKKIPKTNIKYKPLTINDSNNYRYSSYEEIMDILNNGTGIIYLGYNSCPKCRSMINVLDGVTDREIYYLDIHNDSEKFKIVDDKVVVEKKGTKDYHKLVKKLEKYLVSDKNKILVIEYPTVIFVKNGEILHYHTGTVETHINEYYSLTANQEEELKTIYSKYIEDIS